MGKMEKDIIEKLQRNRDVLVRECVFGYTSYLQYKKLKKLSINEREVYKISFLFCELAKFNFLYNSIIISSKLFEENRSSYTLDDLLKDMCAHKDTILKNRKNAIEKTKIPMNDDSPRNQQFWKNRFIENLKKYDFDLNQINDLFYKKRNSQEWKKIKGIRDKILVHIDEMRTNKNPNEFKFPSDDEISNFFELAKEIINKFSIYLDGSSGDMEIHGKDLDRTIYIVKDYLKNRESYYKWKKEAKI